MGREQRRDSKSSTRSRSSGSNKILTAKSSEDLEVKDIVQPDVNIDKVDSNKDVPPENRQEKSDDGSRTNGEPKPPEVKKAPLVNPFLNFLREFKQNHSHLTQARAAIEGGRIWRAMRMKEKKKYLKLAKAAKKLKRRAKEDLY